jgi:iron complex outermembrane receptor protein
MNKFYSLSLTSKLTAGLLLGVCVGLSPTPLHAHNRAALSNYSLETLMTSEIPVKGKVIDATTNEPLIGCSVAVKGSKRGVNTDAKGNFALNVDEKATLVITFVGYERQEIAVNGRTQIEVSLKSTASDLEQVVVVGYGSTTKKDVTGSVKSLKSAEFNQGIINTPESLLQGKVSGVNVTSASGEPGGTQNITVRGRVVFVRVVRHCL